MNKEMNMVLNNMNSEVTALYSKAVERTLTGSDIRQFNNRSIDAIRELKDMSDRLMLYMTLNCYTSAFNLIVFRGE